MSCPTRRFITEPERQQIFDRWFKGESQYSIARSLGRGHTSIQGVLSRTGGIRPSRPLSDVKINMVFSSNPSLSIVSRSSPT